MQLLMKKDRVKTHQTRENDLGLKSFCDGCICVCVCEWRGEVQRGSSGIQLSSPIALICSVSRTCA